MLLNLPNLTTLSNLPMLPTFPKLPSFPIFPNISMLLTFSRRPVCPIRHRLYPFVNKCIACSKQVWAPASGASRENKKLLGVCRDLAHRDWPDSPTARWSYHIIDGAQRFLSGWLLLNGGFISLCCIACTPSAFSFMHSRSTQTAPWHHFFIKWNSIRLTEVW